VCRLIYDRGYSTGADGNVTVRLADGRLLATPSGVHKGFLGPQDFVLLDPSGRPLAGGKPTTELPMHLAVYQQRPDVMAVVHAHPIATVACSIANVDLGEIVVPEVIFGVGAIRMIPYTTPTTDDVPAAIADEIRTCDALVLARHGTVTVGPDLLTAFNRLETVEHTARIVTLSRQLGVVSPLPESEVARLRGIVAGEDVLQTVIAHAVKEVIRRLREEGLA
jgi:L-fuculose-phosphate aldolase